MKYIWLAVPILLILALGIAVVMTQPAQNPHPIDDSDYVDVNGDQYLRQEYVTDPAQELANSAGSGSANFIYPAKISDCVGLKDAASRDRCYLLYAVRSDDVSGCEAARGIDSRDDCFTQLAVQVKRPELCAKVNYGKEECYMQAAIETGNASLCARSAANLAQCGKAVASGNIEQCPVSDDKHFCGDAVIAKDASLCANLRSYDEFCYMQIGIDSNNSSLCNKAGQAADHCFFKIATSVNNEKICEGIAETGVRENCIAWVAFNTNNRALCYKAGSMAQGCIEDIGGTSPLPQDSSAQ